MSYNWEPMHATCAPQKPIIKVINTAYKSYDAQRKAEHNPDRNRQ